MNRWDYLVLIGSMVSIALYAIWNTRGKRDLHTYLKGSRNTSWLTIGLSVMATQASAITFLSTPGQGYEDGLDFVQNYFGAPLALIFIAVVFLPIYRKLNVYTAYEYLGKRFDSKTRLLGAALFLLQRGLGAGITIYAPAIVLSTVMGWNLNLTIVGSGLLVIIYTVSGGSDAVNLTQKYQLSVIFIGMVAAFFVLLHKLPSGLTFHDALTVAGGYHKLQAVDFSPRIDRRYTLWSGVFGGFFLALSYFGTDQSQVQRYLSGTSLRESRLGLMFNAVFKIPMQFGILLLGVMIFVLYRFDLPPIFFNQPVWEQQVAKGTNGGGDRLRVLQTEFEAAHAEERQQLQIWLDAQHRADDKAATDAREAAARAHDRLEAARNETKAVLKKGDPTMSTNDADFVFVHFILRYLPHGLIGLLIAVFFAAALSSKAGELNALGSTTTVDFYRHVIKPSASDLHYVNATKLFTCLWGLLAIAFALFAHLAENLIQATNILGSIFYGVVLGLFLVAFFIKRIGGTAVFWAAIASQLTVFVMYASLNISYLWYNFIGCAACVLFSLILHALLGSRPPMAAISTT